MDVSLLGGGEREVWSDKGGGGGVRFLLEIQGGCPKEGGGARVQRIWGRGAKFFFFFPGPKRAPRLGN